MYLMIQVKQANNSKYNTHSYSIKLKEYMNQIASTENLREQLIQQIYILTDIQKSINNDSFQAKLDNLLEKYNKSIANINGAIISKEDKVSYFDIAEEKSSYEKQKFTMSLQSKCKEVEVVFDKVVTLNAQAIQSVKSYIDSHQDQPLDYSYNLNINNAILSNN